MVICQKNLIKQYSKLVSLSDFFLVFSQIQNCNKTVNFKHLYQNQQSALLKKNIPPKNLDFSTKCTGLPFQKMA